MSLSERIYVSSKVIRRAMRSMPFWDTVRRLTNVLLPTRTVFTTKYGVRLQLNPRDGDASWRLLANEGVMEPDVEYFLSTFLQSGDVVVDVGANVGLTTAISAAR